MKDTPIQTDQELVMETINAVREIGKEAKSGTITTNEALLKTLEATRKLAEQNPGQALQIVAFNLLELLNSYKH